MSPGEDNNEYSKLDKPHRSTVNPRNVNIEIMEKMSLKENLKMYRKFFFEKGEKIPGEPLPQEELDPAELFKSSKGLSASWLGHSSILLNVDGWTVLTDPLFKGKVSLVGPSRFNEKLVIEIAQLPSIDAVIISHDHYDHLNKPSIRLLKDKVGKFIVPLGVGVLLQKWGIPDEKIVELDWWEEYQVKDTLKIAATPSQHFSGRGLFDRNRTLWASWVIQSSHHCVFFSGDSGYFGRFKDIGNKYGPFDVTFLECGAYNKQWSKVHMFPEQTVQAFLDLRGRVLQPIHWATFNLALHAWYEPVERLLKKAYAERVSLSTPVMGQIVDYERPIVTDLWWQPVVERGKKQQPFAVLATGEQKLAR